jgi:hypothetical protein
MTSVTGFIFRIIIYKSIQIQMLNNEEKMAFGLKRQQKNLF